MGCNCNKEEKTLKRKRLTELTNNINTMAKTKYKLAAGVKQHSILRLRDMKIKVSDLTQQTMRAFYLENHPAIVKDESSGKKEK
jgi:hypothetical protein